MWHFELFSNTVPLVISRFRVQNGDVKVKLSIPCLDLYIFLVMAYLNIFRDTSSTPSSNNNSNLCPKSLSLEIVKSTNLSNWSGVEILNSSRIVFTLESIIDKQKKLSNQLIEKSADASESFRKHFYYCQTKTRKIIHEWSDILSN